MTYAYVLMAVSKSTYDEITAKMKEAGWDQAFHDEKDDDGVLIDMHGIALKLDKESYEQPNEKRASEV